MMVLLLLSTINRSASQDSSYSFGNVQWSDTTIGVIEVSSDEAEPRTISVAYIPNLNLKLIALNRSRVDEVLHSLNFPIPSITTWNMFIDSSRGVRFRYPKSLSVHALKDPFNMSFGYELRDESIPRKKNKSIQTNNVLSILLPHNRSFLDEVSDRGLDVKRLSDLFRSDLSEAVYMKGPNHQAVSWKNVRLEFGNSGNEGAREENEFLIVIEDSSGDAATFECDLNLVSLLIASSFIFIH